jgi:hypothetical protein
MVPHGLLVGAGQGAGPLTDGEGGRVSHPASQALPQYPRASTFIAPRLAFWAIGVDALKIAEYYGGFKGPGPDT